MKDPNRAPAYASIYPGLCDVARKRGYALAIHGSMVTDFDIVAVPWTPDACSAAELADAVAKHAQLFVPEMTPAADRTPEVKPHGRLAWLIPMGCGAAIDLSVMPRS